jgi:thiol-disulfide isomerase/thioredoxin
VIAAKRDVGLDGILLTISYAIGAALPMLAIAFAGQRAARGLRARAENVRRAAGVLVALAALAIAFGVDQDLQTHVPGYTQAVQERIERSSAAQRELRDLTGARAPKLASDKSASSLEDYGKAPELAGIVGWINSKPLTLQQLRGRVVLIDFWTYSCINCLRTLPYVKAWDARYRASGLTIVGVHTPEFAFERVPANVRENTKKLGVEYPVALDSDYGTWNAWHNQYWPAKYLIDRSGHVRLFHFGEGEYDETESAIRELLAENGGDLPAAAALADQSPHGLVTPESYLGHARLARYVGTEIAPDREQAYRPAPKLAENELTYGGRWKVEEERAVAGTGARLRLSYRARNVYLVLTGKGSVRVLVDGKPERTVEVDGDRLYTLAERATLGKHLLELRFTPGLAGYAFTFG